MSPKLVINPDQEVFNQLIDKAAETDGWAHQPYDYKFWRENFDNFWFFAIIDQSEEDSKNLMVGACLAQWDGPDGPLFSIGLYYCVEKYRGQGHGSTIFKAIMDIVGDNDACLTGALDMVPKYSKYYGFDKIAPYFHMHSTIKMQDLLIPTDISDMIFTKSWHEVSPEELESYDLQICQRNRKNLMRNWFQMPEVYTRVAMNRSTGTIQGYCTIRVVNLNRLCACPFYADDLETAERLLADTLSEVPNFRNHSEFFMWNPEINRDVEKLFQRFASKFTTERDFKTQFRKQFVQVPDEKVYSVADSTHQFV